ncbi:MAG: gliding motility-associated ABC transporter permease subunit GldF [Flavobacteriales bacterium]|nr:gliding motility-associated ABC transporter permease subunit GldF [Flavobacteriales bacterium]
MGSIFIKELRAYLSSLIAYIIVVVFLLAIGLFMWVYPDTNALDYGYSTLETLFSMAPWVFIFLVSAITMRSLAEEKKARTLEFLRTHPVGDWQIVLGKFLAAWTLVLFALIPTLLYFFTIYQLGSPKGNVDVGATWGSYVGLLMLGACYTAIGMFASSITDNQIVAFVLSIFLCFFFYSAFAQISKFDFWVSLRPLVEWTGISYHYDSISRGVIDTRDIVYFLSFTAVFLGLTKYNFSGRA